MASVEGASGVTSQRSIQRAKNRARAEREASEREAQAAKSDAEGARAEKVRAETNAQSVRTVA